MKTKICFTHCVDPKVAQTQMFGVHYMPVWIYTLAAHIRSIPDIEISMFDIRIMKENEFPSADIYLISGINQDFEFIRRFIEKKKQAFHKAKFIPGGPICWSYQQAGRIEALNFFDHIVVGDGEPVIQKLIEELIAGKDVPQILNWSTKFEVTKAVPMDRELMDATVHKYYGAVIEVSRGCPFLCEFCDIRIQKDNNKSHNKNIELIIEEIEYFAKRGITQILFACDNFIGEPSWAEKLCDAIIEWKQKTGLQVNLYTWLTINLSNYSKLLEKLRLAGFDMFFIGIESFEHNQLLETAKIQNVKGDLVEAIRKIHSYGFIVVAGLIFGFDTEPENVCNSTLDGILKSGLISGEPSLLTALPGTPLYKRLKHSDRLRDGKLGLGGYKYQTNVKYLKPKESIIANFQNFVAKYNTGKFQFERFVTYCDLVKSNPEIKTIKSGYINVGALFKTVAQSPSFLFQMMMRMVKLVANIERAYYLVRTILYTFANSKKDRKLWKYFNFWLFVWSNSIVKFANLSPNDFDIGNVDDSFKVQNLIPKEYLTELNEPIPLHKMNAQRKFTTEALEKFIKNTV